MHKMLEVEIIISKKMLIVMNCFSNCDEWWQHNEPKHESVRIIRILLDLHGVIVDSNRVVLFEDDCLLYFSVWKSYCGFTCSVPNGPQWSCDRCPKPDAQCINIFTKHVIPETHIAAVILPRGAENNAAQASSVICFPWGWSLDIHIVPLSSSWKSVVQKRQYMFLALQSLLD